MEKIAQIRAYLKELNIPAVLISNIVDIHYLSGFSGSSAYMLITDSSTKFFTDGRYAVQSGEEVYDGIEKIIVKKYSDVFEKYCAEFNEILLQPDCTLNESSFISAKIHVDKRDMIRRMRMIKSEDEITLIRHQYSLAGKAFLQSLESFKAGRSEIEWAAALEYNVRIAGAEGMSFPTIVASGARAALPHGSASDKIVNAGEPVIIDFGSNSRYTSDYTRMIYGGNDPEILKVISILKDSINLAVDSVKAGVECKHVDLAARKFIQAEGYGDYFNHSLGHGVGMNVHEFPTVNPMSDFTVENGMVFTIEPGIYIPGKFGARLEETVYIKNGVPEIISTYIPDYVYNPF